MIDPIEPEKLAELRSVAEAAAASTGNRRWSETHGQTEKTRIWDDDDGGSDLPMFVSSLQGDGVAEAAHMVAFDPTTALALVGAAEELAELREIVAEEYVRKGWDGLMTLLDDAYPDDIFPTREDDSSRDAGARIVSLIRLLDRATAQRDELQSRLDAIERSKADR